MKQSRFTIKPLRNMKTTKEKLKLIDTAFKQLDFLNNRTWTQHREALFEMCFVEEKAHRDMMAGGSFASAHTADTISAATAARLMTVKRVAEYLNGEKMPRGKDYLHYQRSCFYAAGLVDECRKEIRSAWRGLPVAELAALDYCEFVKVKTA